MTNVAELKQIRLCDGLSDAQLQALLDIGEQRVYGQGEVVFNEGDEGSHVYCVVEGRVEISMKLGDDTEQAPVHAAHDGSFFGEFVLFEKACRSATVRAVKDTRITALPVDELLDLFEREPIIGYRIMRNLGHTLVGRMSKTTQELRASLMW